MKKKSAALVTAGVITVAAAGGAYAYWTTTGSGTGSATTGTSTAFNVTTDGASGGPLTPGGPSQTVAFHVQNPSSGIQRLQTVTVSVANADGTPWTAVSGCSSADYAVSPASFTPADVAPSGVVSGTVTISMNNLSTIQDACKGVTVPLYVLAG
jgi:hypothetical protein